MIQQVISRLGARHQGTLKASHRTGLSLSLVFLFLVGNSLPLLAPVAFADDIAVHQKQLQQIKAKHQQQQSKLGQDTQAAKFVGADLATIETQEYTVLQNLETAQTSLQNIRLQIYTLSQTVEQQRAATAQQSQKRVQHWRLLYENNQISLLEMVLSVQNFSEFMRTIDVLQAASTGDENFLSDLRREQEQQRQQQSQLAEKQAEAKVLEQQIIRQQKDLDALAQKKRVALAAANGQVQIDQGQLAESERESRQIALLIGAEQAAAAARILAAQQAAERAAAARAAAAAAITANPGGGQSGERLVYPPAPAVVIGNSGVIWPVHGYVTTEFGESNPFMRFHTGIDLAAPVGTPIVAATSGIVLAAGYAVPGNRYSSYGMMVIIARDGQLSTLYAHMEDLVYGLRVRSGEYVQQGQVIGYIGMTGWTTGPHLHFETRIHGDPENPRIFLPRTCGYHGYC